MKQFFVMIAVTFGLLGFANADQVCGVLTVKACGIAPVPRTCFTIQGRDATKTELVLVTNAAGLVNSSMVGRFICATGELTQWGFVTTAVTGTAQPMLNPLCPQPTPKCGWGRQFAQ